MAAGVTIRVYTSTSAGTESSAVTGIDFISADNATNTLGNRQANPVGVGTRSYEKWLKAKVDTAPANNVGNFKWWGDGGVQTSTTLYVTGNYVTGATPTSGTSTVANANWASYTSGNKMTWDANNYSATGATTRYAVFQLEIGSDAAAGNWTQETLNYSYDET